MDYVRVTSVDDPNFARLHRLMREVFPPEEVLAPERWREPLQDPTIRVYVAVHEGEVVGATEYRYLPELRVAMTDFTIVGRAGLSVGRFLWQRRQADLQAMAAAAGTPMLGMFAEVYDPERVPGYTFGGLSAMHPVVRREVLSHLGYRRLDFPYVHPSWQDDGGEVAHLDLCFLPADEAAESLPGSLIGDFLTTYYAVLPHKPPAWHAMIERLRRAGAVALRPL